MKSSHTSLFLNIILYVFFQVSNDESWTDVNLNEDGERGPATITGRTRDHEGNIHEGLYWFCAYNVTCI